MAFNQIGDVGAKLLFGTMMATGMGTSIEHEPHPCSDWHRFGDVAPVRLEYLDISYNNLTAASGESAIQVRCAS